MVSMFCTCILHFFQFLNYLSFAPYIGLIFIRVFVLYSFQNASIDTLILEFTMPYLSEHDRLMFSTNECVYRHFDTSIRYGFRLENCENRLFLFRSIHFHDSMDHCARLVFLSSYRGVTYIIGFVVINPDCSIQIWSKSQVLTRAFVPSNFRPFTPFVLYVPFERFTCIQTYMKAFRFGELVNVHEVCFTPTQLVCTEGVIAGVDTTTNLFVSFRNRTDVVLELEHIRQQLVFSDRVYDSNRSYHGMSGGFSLLLIFQ